jgi:opacity protein-like surface antigen
MKTLTTLCLLMIAFGALQAQFNDLNSNEKTSDEETSNEETFARPGSGWRPTFGFNYGFMLPTGGMKQYIRQGHGLSLNLLLDAPSNRVAAGLELNWTGYGRSSSMQDYEFPDGSIAPMEVNVINQIISLMAVTRLYLALDGPVRPYATLRAGYTGFRTDLTIIDPDNGDPCEPLDGYLLSRDGTFAYSAGGGVRVDAAWIFKKAKKGRIYIDLSSNMMQGGRVNYMSEKPPAHNAMTGTSRARDVEARFINTETMVIHPHHVGYMYNSFMQLMDFRLGVAIDGFDR